MNIREGDFYSIYVLISGFLLMKFYVLVTNADSYYILYVFPEKILTDLGLAYLQNWHK